MDAGELIGSTKSNNLPIESYVRFKGQHFALAIELTFWPVGLLSRTGIDLTARLWTQTTRIDAEDTYRSTLSLIGYTLQQLSYERSELVPCSQQMSSDPELGVQRSSTGYIRLTLESTYSHCQISERYT